MKKYASYGKKILACLLALAVVITTASVDMKVLAAAFSDAPNESIPTGGYIGQITTNGESTNQKVDTVSFKIVKVAGVPYTYTVDIYENPTDSDDPTSGVLRKSIDGSIDSSSSQTSEQIDVSVGNDTSGKPIVLTKGEKLGVSINILGYSNDPIYFYDSDEGTGFTKASASSGWVDRTEGTMLIGTSTYTGTLSDVDSITMAPESTVLSVGDSAVDLNISLSPNYKRDITVTSSDSNVVSINSTQQAVMSGSGTATVTATAAGASTTANFYVLQPTINTDTETYTGSPITKSISVACGSTTLTEDTDYTVTYTNNTNPGTATITITGLGTYAGYSKKAQFTISKGTITQSMVTGGTYVVDTTTDTLTGATIGTLTYGTDFTATAERTSSTITSITYTITVSGIGNFSGGPYTTTKTYNTGTTTLDINSVVDAELATDTFYYSGATNTPEVTFYNKGTSDVVSFSNYVTISYSSDTITASEDTPKVVTITGKESAGYTGTIELEYYVLPRSLTDTGVTITVAEETAGTTNYVHTGYAITPTVTVTYNNGTTTSTLTQGTDYTITYTGNTDVGTATIKLSGAGNFTGTVSKNFEIIPDFVKDATISIGGYSTSYSKNFVSGYTATYKGSAYEPRVSAFKLDGNTVNSSDYTYEYSENVNAGTGKVTVTGLNNYAGKSFTATFTIAPKSLSGSVVVNQLSHTYSGSDVTLASTEYAVYNGSTELTENTDYTISYSNNVNASSDAVISATGTGNYTGSITGTFTIDPLAISDGTVTVDDIADVSYTGSAQTPSVVVRHNGTALTASSDYTVSYTNNINVGTATVTITGTGNFTGSRTTTFKINSKTLQNLTYKLGGESCSGSGVSYTSDYTTTYTGIAQKPSVEVYDSGVLLTEGTDYKLNYNNNINAGTALVQVVGKGGYAGSGVGISFTIEKKSIENVNITLNGTEKRTDGKTYPTVVITDPTASYGKETLTENTDYTLVPDSSASSAGPDRKCSIVGTGNYKDETSVTYDVGNNLANGSLRLYLPDSTVVEKVDDAYYITYMGETSPTVQAYYNSIQLTQGTDFTVDLTPVTGTQYGAGSTIKITVTGIGDYYGTLTEQYYITKKDISDLTLSDGNTSTSKISNWTYYYDSKTKSVTPAMTYTVSGITNPIELTQDTDFTVSKSTVGPAVISGDPVIITGKGNYSGTRTVSYTINQFDLSDESVTIAAIPDQQYTSNPITPSVTVTRTLSDSSTITLTSNDYTVSYENNVNVGTATVTITGKNNYTGTHTGTFNIITRTLTDSNTKITGLDSVIYDGTAKEPSFSLYYGDAGLLLTKDTDYTVTYSNNVKVGPSDLTGPVIQITGIGAYDGTVSKGFAIKGEINNTDIFTVSGIEDSYDIVNNDITVGTPIVKYSPGGVETVIDSSYYTLNKPSTIVPGTATITVVGDGEVMTGTYSKTVSLVGNLDDATISGINESYDYTGSEVKPKPVVTFNGKTLVEGSDYQLVYANNTEVGTATVTVKPVDGNTYYTGTKSTTYAIKYNLNKATVTGYNPSYEYTGSQITPSASDLQVTVAGQVLTRDTHYTIGYGDNVNVLDGGTIVVTATGDDATGSKTVSFSITPVELSSSNCSAVFAPASYSYTGQPIQAVPTVTYGGTRTLTSGTDFTLTYPDDTTNIGSKTVTVKGTGNYKGSLTGTYSITAVDINNATITVENAYYAGGKDVTPPHTIIYNGITLVKGTDYDIYITGDHKQVANNIPIRFTGKGNFTNSYDTTFNIGQADLSLGAVTISETSSEYTGAAITPTITATIDTGDGDVYTLVEGTADSDTGDYYVTYNDFTEMVDAGTYSIKITGKGNFINSLNTTYTVTPRTLSGDNITITYNADQEYTGSAVEPTVTITDSTRSGGSVVLTKDVDYTVTYSNNTAAASMTDTNPPTITITGIGNYADTVTKTFNIGHQLTGLTVALEQEQYTYDGEVHKPEVTVKKGTTILDEGTDYSVVYANSDGTDVDENRGTKVVTITGLNGYYGTKTVNYYVVAKVADANKIRIVPNLSKDGAGHYYTTYTGGAIEPEVQVYDDEISTTTPVDTSNYDIEYTHNTDMSTATNPAVIHIHFKNNYAEGADAYTQDFYINPKTIESGFQAYLEDGTQYSYTGSAVEPKVVVSPTTVDVEEGSLVEGEDYTLTYYNNVNAGEATVTVQGIGNYSGTVVLPFNVVASLTSANITAEDQFYTGQEIHAPLTVTCGGNTLVAGTDYKVTYNSDDNWESTGTATITPLKQYYSGEGSVTYDIIFDPDLLEVSNYNKTYTYTGSSIKPNFIVKTPSGEQLMYDSDDVTYYNSSTGAGDTTSIGTITASIPITVGSKSCTLKVKYEIVSKSIENCTIMPLNDNVYSGRALYPPVIVKDGNTYLTEGTDYTLSYSNNTNPGTGYVTITGKGDYDGEMVATFNIISPNVLGLSGSAVDDTSVKLTWLRNARITGYEIYSEDGATKYGTTSANTFTVTGLNSGQTYTFKVRTYVKVGTTTTYGAFNTVTVHTGLSKPSITGSSYARKRATINWSGTTDVTGYEIYRSTSSNGTYSKIAVMPATAGGYSDSGLNSGSTYYYKVRAYEKVGDNAFIYGYFSDSIAITVR